MVSVYSFFVMFDCCLLEARSFLMRDRKGMDLDGRGGREELVGVEKGKL